MKVRLQFNSKSQLLSSIGYSVLEAKKLLSYDDYTVVTGSPRDESKGSVMLGTKTDKIIETTLTIPGEQVGSYFGNSLAVTDLNNDECVFEHLTVDTIFIFFIYYYYFFIYIYFFFSFLYSIGI